MTPAEVTRRVEARRRERMKFWGAYKRKTPGQPATRKEPQMAYEQRDNSGSLFRNDRREKDTHPHAKGKAMVDGVWYWVSAWTKEPRAGGDKFQSLSFERMTDEQVEKYVGGAGGGSYADGGVNRPSTPAGRAERDSRGPSQRPERAADGGRGRDQMPFGQEKVFESSDIPFAWDGRRGQPL